MFYQFEKKKMVLYDENIAITANKTGKKEIRNNKKDNSLEYMNTAKTEKITA